MHGLLFAILVMALYPARPASASAVPQVVYLPTEQFEPYFYQVVRTTTFKQTLQELVWEQTMMSAFRDTIDRQVKQTVTDQAKLAVGDIATDKVKLAIKDLHDSLVREANDAVAAAARKFVTTDETIRAMIATHHVAVKKELDTSFEAVRVDLEKKCREHLARIVAEPEYHTINAALIENLKQNYRETFKKLEEAYESRFNHHVSAQENRVTAAISSLNTNAATVTETAKNIGELRRELAAAQQSINNLGWACAILGTIVAIVGISHFSRR